MLPPFLEERLAPSLTRMQIETRSSRLNPHQSSLRQMRQGRLGETVVNPPDTNVRGREGSRWLVIAGIAVPVSA